MKKTTKYSFIVFFAFCVTAVVIFFSIFERIELISWGDPIVLKTDAITKFDNGIWKGEYDYHLDCGDCVIKKEYLLSISYTDSIAVLIEVSKNYENTFELPFTEYFFGKVGETSNVFNGIYELRGTCIVRMAKYYDEQLEVGPPKFTSYSKIGCDLLSTDWPVISYVVQHENNSIIIERYQ